MDRLRSLIDRELVGRSEPWVRRFLDPGTGDARAEVVTALALVGVGLERDSAGDPLSDAAFREQLAAWLVDTLLVNPNDARNALRPQFQTVTRLSFDERAAPRPGVRAIDALAELALGAHRETNPRAARVAAPDLVVVEYLRGLELPAPGRETRRASVKPAGARAAKARPKQLVVAKTSRSITRVPAAARRKKK